MYIPMNNLNVFSDQHAKLKNAITHQQATSIKLNLVGNSSSSSSSVVANIHYS